MIITGKSIVACLHVKVMQYCSLENEEFFKECSTLNVKSKSKAPGYGLVKTFMLIKRQALVKGLYKGRSGEKIMKSRFKACVKCRIF